MPGERCVRIECEDDIITARQIAREAARELGFSLLDQSRVATAVSELTRNVVRYATDGRGMARIRTLAAERTIGIEVVVSDDGPGMANVEQALHDGFTTGDGLGLGLPGTRRLMHEMEIDSAPGRGTTVTIRRWRR